MESLENLNKSIATNGRWVDKLFHGYRLLPIISSDEKTLRILSRKSIWAKMAGPLSKAANISTLVNSITGMSLLNAPKEGGLLGEAWNVWEKHRDDQKTINDVIEREYVSSHNKGYNFGAVQTAHSPVRAPDNKFLPELYNRLDSVTDKFVVVRGIISNVNKLPNVKDAVIGNSLKDSGIEWLLSDFPYFAMGHDDFRSGVALLEMDTRILSEISNDIPFNASIGWYPYVRVYGYAKHPYKPRYNYPSIKVSWLEYRPPKLPDEVRDDVIRAYRESNGSFATREAGFHVHKDRVSELQEFIDIMSIIALAANLDIHKLRPQLRELVAEASSALSELRQRH